VKGSSHIFFAALKCHPGDLSESLFLKLIIPVVIIAIIAVIIIAPRLEFLVSFIPVVTSIISAFPIPVVGWAEAFYVWCIGKLQLATGDNIQFALYRIVMHRFLVPVIIGQLHIVGDGIGEPIAFVGIFFRQGFVNNDFQVFAQMGKLGIPFGIF